MVYHPFAESIHVKSSGSTARLSHQMDCEGVPILFRLTLIAKIPMPIGEIKLNRYLRCMFQKL